jgi:hypothetical protein
MIINSVENLEILISSPVYIPQGAGLRAFRAHADDLDVFLFNATARIAGSIKFDITLRQNGTNGVFLHTIVRSVGSVNDEAELVRGIQFAEAVVKVLGPLVEGIVLGRLTPRQAFDFLDRALADAERRARGRIA